MGQSRFWLLGGLVCCVLNGCGGCTASHTDTTSSGSSGGSSGSPSGTSSGSASGSASSGGTSSGASSGVSSSSSGATSSGANGSSGTAVDGGVDGGVTVTLAQFCSDYGMHACNLLVACGVYSQAGMDECLAREGNDWQRECEKAAQAPGLFDPAGAADCFASLDVRPARCGPYGHHVQMCLGPFGGAQPFCGLTRCQPGTVCDSDCVTPTCRAPGGIGDVCQMDSAFDYRVCDGDAGFCHVADGGTGTCAAPLPLGARCVGLGGYFAAPCEGNASCQAIDDGGSVCTSALPDESNCTSAIECASSVCRPDGHCGRGATGASCSFSYQDCKPGLRCLNAAFVDGGGIAPGTCGPAFGVGQSCTIDLIDPCDNEHAIICLDGTCVNPPEYTQGEGEECLRAPFGQTQVRYYGFMGCQPQLGCMKKPGSIRGTCLPLLGPGEACEWPSECQAGLTCNGSTCVSRATEGQPCADLLGDCLAELACRALGDGGAQCGVRPGQGADCSTNYALCAAETVCDESGVCNPPASSGAICTFDAQCFSGTCVNGQCALAQCL